MKDIRNMELKTVSKVASSQASTLNIGGIVPAGMKRWVTFVSIDTPYGGASQMGVYLASVGVSVPTKASLVATANRKMLILLRATTGTAPLRKTPLQIPKAANTETPLFSIAGGKWLGVFATKTTALLTVQYFDE